MTRTPYLLLALSLLAAGCIGGDADEGVTPAATDESAATDKDAATPGAAKSTAPATAAEPETASPEPAAPPEEIPLSWEGKFGTGFCAPMGPDSCIGMGLTPGDNWKEMSISGFESGFLTLTWTASTPAHTNLVISVSSFSKCGENCWESTGTVREGTEGASPLTLEFGAATLAEGEVLAISVRQPRLTPSPVFAAVSTDQPFQVEGSFLGYP